MFSYLVSDLGQVTSLLRTLLGTHLTPGATTTCSSASQALPDSCFSNLLSSTCWVRRAS